jgi:hypothetical protein
MSARGSAYTIPIATVSSPYTTLTSSEKTNIASTNTNLVTTSLHELTMTKDGTMVIHQEIQTTSTTPVTIRVNRKRNNVITDIAVSRPKSGSLITNNAAFTVLQGDVIYFVYRTLSESITSGSLMYYFIDTI